MDSVLNRLYIEGKISKEEYIKIASDHLFKRTVNDSIQNEGIVRAKVWRVINKLTKNKSKAKKLYNKLVDKYRDFHKKS